MPKPLRHVYTLHNGLSCPLLFLVQLLYFERVHVAAGKSATVTIPVVPALLLMTSETGARSVYPGSYTLAFTRGPGNTDDVSLGATVTA